MNVLSKKCLMILDKLRYIVIISDISCYIFITQKGASYMFGNRFAFEYSGYGEEQGAPPWLRHRGRHAHHHGRHHAKSPRAISFRALRSRSRLPGRIGPRHSRRSACGCFGRQTNRHVLFSHFRRYVVTTRSIGLRVC